MLFCLNSGAVLNGICGSLHYHDLRLFRQLWELKLKSGDILLGDRAYGEYTTSWPPCPRAGWRWWPASTRSARSIFAKPTAWAKMTACLSGPVAGSNPPSSPPSNGRASAGANFRAHCPVHRHHLRGFRARRVTLVTTLLHPVAYPAHELAALYARRWRLELCLRDLKTTLGMDHIGL